MAAPRTRTKNGEATANFHVAAFDIAPPTASAKPVAVEHAALDPRRDTIHARLPQVVGEPAAGNESVRQDPTARDDDNLASMPAKMSSQTELAGLAMSGLAFADDADDAGEQPDPKPLLQGFIDRANRAEIVGWVWDAAQPQKRIPIELIKQRIQLATAVASDDRPGLARAGIGDGRHAFYLKLKPGLLSEQRHVLHLQCADTGAAIPGSPIVLEPSFDGTGSDPRKSGVRHQSDRFADEGAKRYLANLECGSPLPDYLEQSGHSMLSKMGEALTQSSMSLADLRKGDAECNELRATGLFDEAYYLTANLDVVESGADGVEHFCRHGWRELRAPNRYFDVTWYLRQMPIEQRGETNPVLHYAHEGERQGLRPTLFFDPTWYRSHYGLSPQESPLRHFLAHAGSGRFSPTAGPSVGSGRDFDAASSADQISLLRGLNLIDIDYYVESNPGASAPNGDPLEHFHLFGHLQGKNPNYYFNTKWYIMNNSDIAGVQPLLHYAFVGEKEGRRPSRLFDPEWYRCAYNLPPEQGALAHYPGGRRVRRGIRPPLRADRGQGLCPRVPRPATRPFRAVARSHYERLPPRGISGGRVSPVLR